MRPDERWTSPHKASTPDIGPRGIIAATAGLITVVSLGFGLWLWNSRAETLRETLSHNRALTQTVASFTEQVMEGIDQHLLFIQARYRRGARHGDLAELDVVAADIKTKAPYIARIVIFDADGKLIRSAGQKDLPEIRPPRHFAELRDNPHSGRLLTSVVQSTFDPGRWRFALSRRLDDGNGNFLGIASISVDVENLSRAYDALRANPSASVTLMYLDGTVIGRSPFQYDFIGRGLPSFARYQGDPPAETAFIIASQVDGVRRVIAQRRFANFPMLVAVTLTEEAALTHWRSVLPIILTTWAGTIMFIVAGGVVSYRRQAESHRHKRALAESEGRLKHVIQATHDGIWDWTIATGEDYLSPRWKEILGYRDSELPNIASSFFDRIHPDDKVAVENAVRRHLENDEPYRAELRLRHKDGTWRWTLSRGQAVRDTQGNPVRMVGSITDITEQKAARESLQGERDRLRQILDAQFGFVTVLALDGAIEEINRTPLKLINLSRDQVLGRRFWDIGWLEPGTEPSIQATIAAAARGQVVRDDIRAHFPGMGPRDVDAIFHPLKDATGRIINVIAFGVDITERKQAEAALKKAHAELEERIEARTHELSVERERFQISQTFANIGTWDWNIVTGALYWSERIGPLFGYGNRKIETTYENFLAAIHPDDRQAVIDAVNACVEKGAEYNIEHRIVRADGQVRWLSEKGDVLRDALGRPMRMLGVVQDITDRKMTEDHLRHTQKLESLGNMAGGVAHSLNNLLVPILALSKMTADGLPQGSPARLALDKVVEASGRAKDLVARVLAFSRQDPPRKITIDLCAAVEGALRLIRSSVPPTIQLDSEIPEQPIRVMADAPQIEAVILNLVTNAVAAIGDHAGGRIAIRLAACDDGARTARRPNGLSGHPCAVLAVEDNGIGMAAATKERVFDPFFTTKKVGEGTGLGLSMAHGIVEEHGGSIDVDSEPGKGSTFRIHLPLAPTAHPAHKPA